MAIFLIKKGKNKLAITTFSKGEKYFLKIPALLEKSKKQGVSPSSDFIETLKVSNSKHKEVGEELLKLVPQTQAVGINEILKINKEIKEKLEKL